MKQLFLSHRSTRIALSLVALLTFSLFGSTAAFAAVGPTATGTIIGADTIAFTEAFATTGTNIESLAGLTQIGKQIGTLKIDVVDFTGKGTGWSVTASALPLTLKTNSSRTLATRITSNSTTPGITGIVALTPQTVNSDPLGVADLPTTNNPSIEDSNILIQASLGKGMGSYSLTDAILVDVLANSYAGEYSTTIAITEAQS